MGLNQKGDGEILLFIIFAVVLFVGGFFLWRAGANADEATCKQRYGSEYTLHMDAGQSDIRSCVSPEGVMKAL